VLIFTPDSTSSKTFSRCLGLATVIVKKSPYSCIVNLNGTKMHIHANKLHKYHTRVQQVLCLIPPFQCQTSIIYEKDDDFADITVPNMVPSISQILLLSQRIDPSHLSHLDFHQQETLLNLLSSFSDCFSDIPVFCSLVQLCCKTTASLQDICQTSP